VQKFCKRFRHFLQKSLTVCLCVGYIFISELQALTYIFLQELALFICASMVSLCMHNPTITPTVITRGNPNLPEVALTFDDGPGQYTPQVLETLQRYNVPATFFVIGQSSLQYPGYLQQDFAAGNAVGNHTFTHPHLPNLSTSEIYSELSQTQNAIYNATGTRPTVFRPPYGEYNNDAVNAASQLGMTVVNWSAAANDWENPPPAADVIASRILSAAANGAIFLLHEDGGDRSNTVAALPAIISELQSRGFRLVTIPEMLAHLNE
jgi:peptidoglycan-N-acetylglucosamine deacetylase